MVEEQGVTIISPTNGAIVSNIITVTAMAPANTVKVEFYRDGVLFATVWNSNLLIAPSNLLVKH